MAQQDLWELYDLETVLKPHKLLAASSCLEVLAETCDMVCLSSVLYAHRCMQLDLRESQTAQKLERKEEITHKLNQDLETAWQKIAGMEQELQQTVGKLQLMAGQRDEYTRREAAYNIIKRNTRVYILRKRLSSIMRDGRLSQLYKELKTKDGVLRKVAFMQMQYFTQVRATD